MCHNCFGTLVSNNLTKIMLFTVTFQKEKPQFYSRFLFFSVGSSRTNFSRAKPFARLCTSSKWARLSGNFSMTRNQGDAGFDW